MANREIALKDLKKARSTIKGQITRVQTYILETQDLNVYELEARTNKVKDLVVAYENVQSNIENIDEVSDHVSERDNFERGVFSIQALLASHVDRLRGVKEPTPSSRQASSSTELIKPANKMLPKIQIPSFDGNLINWFSFYDTFKSLVHENEDLPNVQKFHYLKNSLRGEISSIVASLNASAENYLVAWELLQKRCNRPRQLIQAHLKQLFDLPEITRDTPANLRKLAEQAQVHVNALKGLNQPIDSWDQILIFIIVKKLDKTTRRAWERKLENDELPKFERFIEFINTQARGEEVESERSNFPSDKDTLRIKPKRSFTHLATNKNVSCAICQSEHFIFACPKFLAMEVKDRLKLAQKSKLCLNCLKAGHNTVNCTWSHCRKCDKKHNTLLHLNSYKTTQASAQGASEEAKDVQNEIDVTSRALMAVNNSEVLLGTAQITIYDSNNKKHTCRVLVDGGSQSNYITESLANLLQLERERVNITSSGLSNLVTCAKYCVNAKIESRTNNFSSRLKFIALPTITGFLPTRSIKHKDLNIPKNICLADPEFYKPGSIDILLGSTIFYQLLSVGQIQLNNNRIILQRTKLGWLVTGEVDVKTANRNTSCFISLEHQITKFWELEELPKGKFLSNEETACEEHYKQNTKREQSGRYIVRLPFNEKRNLLGDSHNLALKRFYSLENKLIKNPVLYGQYKDFLTEYESLNHMSEVSSEDHGNGFYLPHHAVIKTSSATTKMRVVFDASAKSSSGISLNDTLLVGPTIQNTLFTTLIRFRTHIFVLTADIEKMFRQIKIHEEDSHYQKILWRQSVEQPLKTYKLNTVTYGTACAPFLAIRCLKQLAEDEVEKFPLAARAFEQDFYVDDLLTGASDFNSALKLRNELVELAKLGGFNLRQWVSNDKNLIIDLDNNQETKSLGLDSSNTKKTLGIFWNPPEDRIIYKTDLSDNKLRITKRLILSEIAQLFDPLGLLGPVIIQAKMIMQELWKTQIEWDEVVPQSIYYSWSRFRDQLKFLEQFSIQRPLLVAKHIDCQLHGFCDASESAYGACIFIRVTTGNMQHSANLLCAKSRVAPIRTQSLPRLELCAATLLANLVAEVTEALIQLKFSKIRLWTDSTIVLHWINTSPHLLKTFVANRVSNIQTTTDKKSWFHVPTLDNPADYISRGQDPQHFVNNITWIRGPQWLSKDESSWPNLLLETTDIPEKRKLVSLVTVIEPNSILMRFSSFKTLYRVVAYMLRFLNNSRGSKKCTGPLTPTEIQAARNRVVRLVQRESLSEDINSLEKHKIVHNQSKLRNLNPFLDEDGLLRVGGRLKNAPISFSQKHPIILPHSHHVTNLVIKYEHERHWHAGIHATMNAIRQRYWPISAKGIIKRIIGQCIQCHRFNPKTSAPLMGELPTPRVTQSRPFENVGIDYCGPFFIKEKKNRNRLKVKSYVVVFICFVTKAIHLELVSDLTTETCLGAIARFFSRRGRAKNIYTDNGTNFVGSRNQIIELQSLIWSEEFNNTIKDNLSNDNINWHFSPPRSPHFGGLWESAVKSFKRHLFKTVGETLFTYEQFNSLIIQIEAVLNSRPIIPISSDPNDLTALTPGHFLIGDALTNLPEGDLTEVAANKLSLWQHIQQVKQHFWKRWHTDYLHELHIRNKWHRQGTSQMKVGTLVTIQEDNVPPMHWRLGRIVTIHPGDDNIVRVVTVKTAQGLYKRSITKLSPLPIE